MSKDAYDLLEEAKKIWQEKAMRRVNAGTLSKGNAEPINLWCKTPYGWYKINSVYYDETYGIMLDHDESPKNDE